MKFYEAFIDELSKIALDISMDPKKMILQKQFETTTKGMEKMTAGSKQKPPKEPSVIYHVKVRPGE